MSRNGSSPDAALKAAENNLIQSGREIGRALARLGETEPGNYFTGLIGEDVFIGGHRYHFVGRLSRVELTSYGEAVAYLDNAWQIDYDEHDAIQDAFPWGDGLRIPESCVGLGVQPISGRSPTWQKSWEKFKARGLKRAAGDYGDEASG